MTLHVPHVPSYGLILQSHGTTRPSNTWGVQATAGTGQAYGSYAQIIAGSAVTADAYGILLTVHSFFTSAGATKRQGVVTIGLDPAGGTSYTDTLTDIVVDSPGNLLTAGGVQFFFPWFIPSGASIGVKVKNQENSQTARVACVLFCKPRTPEAARKGRKWRVFGQSGVAGTTFTPGTTGEGAWASLGTVADDDLWWWQVAMTASDATYGATCEHVDLGIGDASNKHLVIVNNQWVKTTSEDVHRGFDGQGAWRAKNGDIVYIRGQSSGTADTGTTGAAYAVGG